MKKIKLKNIVSLLIVISILFLNSFSLIASAYGADIDDWDYCAVYIRNVSNGKYITVPNGKVANSKQVALYDATETVSQEWGISRLSNGYYSINSQIDSHYVLALENGKDSNNANIVLKYLSDPSTIPVEAQFDIWSFTDEVCAFVMSVTSINNRTFRPIDCKNKGTANGTQLVQCDLDVGIDGMASQFWVFESLSRSVSLNNWNLVDIGGHCDWDCSSQYGAMVRKAANAWNNYIGDTVFRPDAWNIIQDIKITDLDMDPTGGSSLGRTYSKSITANGKYASSIYFYKQEMDKLDSDLQREHTVMHEMGHALGLGHNRTSTVPDKLGNIMQQGALPYSTYIGLDDIASVKEACANF